MVEKFVTKSLAIASSVKFSNSVQWVSWRNKEQDWESFGVGTGKKDIIGKEKGTGQKERIGKKKGAWEKK